MTFHCMIETAAGIRNKERREYTHREAEGTQLEWTSPLKSGGKF